MSKPLVSALLAAAVATGVVAGDTATTPADVARRLNVFLLTNAVTDRVVIEVDWVEGTEPNAKALDALLEAVRGLTPDGKKVELVLDEEIPLTLWESIDGAAYDKVEALPQLVDNDPSAWRERELVYVLYVPGEAEVHGWQLPLAVGEGERRGLIPGVIIYQEELRSEAALWIGPRKIERAILIHEFGHAFGLVGNTDHEREGDRGHCTRAGCVLASRTPRALTQGAFAALFAGKVPYRYCKLCRRDVRDARAYWKQQARENPNFRRDRILERAAWEASVFAGKAKQAANAEEASEGESPAASEDGS